MQDRRLTKLPIDPIYKVPNFKSGNGIFLYQQSIFSVVETEPGPGQVSCTPAHHCMLIKQQNLFMSGFEKHLNMLHFKWAVY